MKKIIIASGPVIVENNKVLLNKHGEDKFWKFCGGMVEDDNHRLAEVAKLKAKQEMGINIEVINNTPFILPITKEKEDGKIDILLVHYLSKRIGDIKPGEETLEWKWIDINELNSYNDLAPNIIPTLKHFGFIK